MDAARAKSIPANAVDQPGYCDFYTPGLVSRAPLAVAICTEGAGPVLGQIVRARIDQMLAPSLVVWLVWRSNIVTRQNAAFKGRSAPKFLAPLFLR